jgi:hypothetical protein
LRSTGFGKNVKVKGLSRQQIFSLKDSLLSIDSLDVERKLVVGAAIDVLKHIGSHRGSTPHSPGELERAVLGAVRPQDE